MLPFPARTGSKIGVNDSQTSIVNITHPKASLRVRFEYHGLEEQLKVIAKFDSGLGHMWDRHAIYLEYIIRRYVIVDLRHNRKENI